MNINNILLSSQDNEKIQLLVFLKENPSSSLYNFFLAKDLPYNKVLYIYHKLIADLREFEDDDLTIAELIADADFDQYSHIIMNRQVGYKMLMSLITQTDHTTNEFLERQQISRTKLYRLTSDLRKYIGQFGVTVNLSEFCLTGNETLIQNFLLAFLNETGTNISEFLDDRWQSLVSHLTDGFLTPMAFKNSILVAQRRRFVGIALLRLSQGHRYQIAHPIDQHFGLKFINGSDGVVKDYIKVSCDLTDVEAQNQFNLLKFSLKFGPNFIIEISDDEKQMIDDWLKSSPQWQQFWQRIETGTPTGLTAKMKLRLVGCIISLDYFGNFPISRNNYVNDYLQKVSDSRISKYYDQVNTMIKELQLEITTVDGINSLAKLFEALEQVIDDVSHKITVYVNDDAYDAQTDIISYLFQGVVSVKMINEYEPEEVVSILVYNQQNDKVNRFLAAHPNMISLRWVQQLPATENYSRLLLLINKYRYNVFKNL
jgi:DNA-directed RNA polymerase subunit L